ncbi:MAG: hypothetical protein WC438_05730 [Candidatus Pacearchaeota archaeon]|jgi:hypothetical protein
MKKNMVTVEENYQVIGSVDIDNYNETRQAQPTGRLLDGSRDYGYYIEYAGYGTIALNGKEIEVKAIYLFDKKEYEQTMQDYDGDEGSLDWFNALKRFEVIN